jgi:acid phosphatase (class A)
MQAILILLLAMLVGGSASATSMAETSVPEPDLRLAHEPVPFLLDPAQRAQSSRILPPAPVSGTPRYEADRAVFRRTRALRDSSRWALASRDVGLGVPVMLTNFSCAVGTPLSPVKTPMLAGLLTRVSADAERVIEPAKAVNRRLRPFRIDKGAVCQAKEKLDSYDYPSGHATWGWTIGLLLAELAPDRASDVLVRARVYGESRVVCGAHNLSAIEAGETNAAALVATLHGSAAFRDAMQAVRGELAAAREADDIGPDRASCAAETAAAEASF